MKKELLHKLMNCIAIIGTIALVILIVLGWRKGIFQDRAVLEALLQKAGFWAPLCFLVIQIVQVVIPLLPGGVSCAVGVLVFGAVEGFIYNVAGLTIGSMIAFLLAKRFGARVVQFFVQEKTYNKYIGWLDKGRRFEIFLIFALFLPGLPDDALCMLSGLTKMTWKKFLAIFLLTKPISIALYSVAYAYADKFTEIYNYLYNCLVR
ncbi:MAG: TVP38/TMEM64 family protein [Faecalimonas sp.]|nr:TVP38/TMEM64 family protein [Faecalimonas sp.]